MKPRTRKQLFILIAALFLMPTSAALADDGLNDAQIAHIVVTANQVDIDAGKLAQTAAKDPEVKSFAKQMIVDHSGVNKSAAALTNKLGVTPQDNPTSPSLKSGGQENVKHLKALRGADFDRAYVDHEVAYHQQVLDAIDTVLLPGAKNEELKTLLAKVRPAFDAHLQHAKTMQSRLGA